MAFLYINGCPTCIRLLPSWSDVLCSEGDMCISFLSEQPENYS